MFELKSNFEHVPARGNAPVKIAIALVAAVLAACLCACSAQEPAPSQTSSPDNRASAELYGSPWTTSVFAGNLPSEAPEATQDLYTHYAYEYAASHQDAAFASAANDASGELQDAVTTAVNDASFSTPEMEQLRIFYDQAADISALEAGGAESLKPYLRAVMDAQSLDELEAVLLSPDFPFCPWLETTVSAANMKSVMCVAVMPNMLFSDEESGTEYYQDADDAGTQAVYEAIRAQKQAPAAADLQLVSLADTPQAAQSRVDEMFELERVYGKEDDSGKYLDAEYGAQTQAIKVMTHDELAASCPNFPVRETLAKLGEDRGDVIVMYPEWLAAFNGIWTDENFELLRDMTTVKILRECSDFIAPSFYDSLRAETGQAAPTSAQHAYDACNRTDTFTQLLAKIYVERELGDEAWDALEKLTNELIDDYIVLVGETSWLDLQTRENVIEKIDNIALNILYPDGGYFDYSGLKLVPSAEGGTLLDNYLAVKAYNDQQEAALIGQTARASATWLYMKPTSQNCFYDSISNSINIFPGYLTSATYSKGMVSEELLATMGFAIGHEVSHAFDYTGSQFNAYGEPLSVFTDADVAEFVAKRKQIADYYSAIEVEPGVAVDGMRVSAEATADLCGMQVILKRAGNIAGFDYERMFGEFAGSWAMVCSPAYADMLAAYVHALNNLRANVNAQMFDEYYAAYGTGEGDAMYLAPERRLAMWGKNAG